MADESRELVLLAVTGWRFDALGNLTLIGGPLGPDVLIEAADLPEVWRALATPKGDR